MSEGNETKKTNENPFSAKSFWIGFLMFAIGCFFIGIGVIAGDAILDALGIGSVAVAQAIGNGVKVG